MMMTYVIAILCVLSIAIGQLLFKLSAVFMHQAGSYLEPRALMTLSLALLFYAITTLAWVWVLQKAELGHIYPLMAFAFVLVPLGSYFIFAERFQPQYFVGVVLIVLGIILTMSASV